MDTKLLKDFKRCLKLPSWFGEDHINQVITYLMTDPRGTTEGKSNFNHMKDYRYVYPSFLQLYNVDLNKQDITWWEYCMMLEGCFFNDCTLSGVVSIRSQKIPPKADAETKRSISSQKHKYMLRSDDNGLGTMFKSLKGRAKNGS